MNIIRLPVQKMTREAFAPYGILLDRRGSIDVDIGMGVPSITGATADPRPFRFDFMARARRLYPQALQAARAAAHCAAALRAALGQRL